MCGTDGVVYQNQCLLEHAACEKGIDIQKEGDGPCNGDNENNDNKHSEAFDTTGDDEEGDNSQEDDEILNDAEGNKRIV